MDITNLLQRLGFSQNETIIYLASLELGLSSAQDIAKKANIKRTTAYSVLDYLVQRGIMSKTEIKGKTRFLVEPPEKLHSMITGLQEQLTKLMPKLNSLYKVKSTRPKITFYEGNEAIQNVYDDTLREKPKEILEWNTNRTFERLTADKEYVRRRVKLNIKARRMATGTQWRIRQKKNDIKELAKTLILPKNKLNPDIEVNIYNNKVAFLNFAENMSVIIESKAIADTMKQVYELSWESAEKYS